MTPSVDLVLLTRDSEPLSAEVQDAIDNQSGVQLSVHRVIGQKRTGDSCRWEVIARARNEAKFRGSAPWMMFLDDDVVLHPQCIARLVDGLRCRPAYAALAADYLGDICLGQMANHVSMGATLFRREVLEQLEFTWRDRKCECQCCCDDLRQRHWGIDYYPAAKARHLPRGDLNRNPSPSTGIDCHPQQDHDEGRGGSDSADGPSVCLVLCYFGPPPGWVEHYLLSCEYNPSINFLIVTDQGDFPAVPPNVRVLRLSVSAFIRLASQKLGAEVRLQHPRKLCDFKPLYGHLFEEHLAGWDYWGYTDLDVIYGDIRGFLSAARLNEYDVFTARKEFLVGHFTLLRNTPHLRTLYQQSANYHQALWSPRVMSFDECGRQWLRRMRGLPLTNAATCDSMTHVVHRLMAQQKISVCFSPAVLEWPELPNSGWRLRWEAGRLRSIEKRREFMYVHFHGFKRHHGFQEPSPLGDALSFELSPDGIERVLTSNSQRKPVRGSDLKQQFSNTIFPEISTSVTAESGPCAKAWEPRVLLTFNRDHLDLFHRLFLASFRAAGNHDVIYPIAVGLYPSERKRLARITGVNPVFCHDSGEHVARRRLREFAEITRALPPATPVAYWDAGDVLFQSRLESLWELVRSHPQQLLAVREPSGYPENPAVVQWTETIVHPSARRDAQRAVFYRPFLNSGFLAGTAGTLTTYFDTTAHWYDNPKLAGSADPGDQLALNVYCHSQPDAWCEISAGWNYCLWGRKRSECYRDEKGRFVDSRGISIHVVHGNAQTLRSIPARLARFRAALPAMSG